MVYASNLVHICHYQSKKLQHLVQKFVFVRAWIDLVYLYLVQQLELSLEDFDPKFDKMLLLTSMTNIRTGKLYLPLPQTAQQYNLIQHIRCRPVLHKRCFLQTFIIPECHKYDVKINKLLDICEVQICHKLLIACEQSNQMFCLYVSDSHKTQ